MSLKSVLNRFFAKTSATIGILFKNMRFSLYDNTSTFALKFPKVSLFATLGLVNMMKAYGSESSKLFTSYVYFGSHNLNIIYNTGKYSTSFSI